MYFFANKTTSITSSMCNNILYVRFCNIKVTCIESYTAIRKKKHIFAQKT